METIRDIYVYIRRKFDDDYQRRRNSSCVRTSSTFGLEMRNGLQTNRRSISIPLSFTHQLNNASKRPSSETIMLPQLNSRRTSKGIFHVQEL